MAINESIELAKTFGGDSSGKFVSGVLGTLYKDNFEKWKNLSELEKKINVKFKNKDLIKQALIHRSYLNENPNFSLGHNERLEFLGDAVLELVVTEFLYTLYPGRPEGELTNFRASLVNSQMLSELAFELDLEEYIF